MYIKRICYPVRTLGPGERVGIWVTGCEKKCKGCMSPDLRKKTSGQSFAVVEIIQMLKSIRYPIDGITISGGEPFLQVNELRKLVYELNRQITKDIIIYSGLTIEELQRWKGFDAEYVLKHIAVLIDGPYIEELDDGIGIRGSSNQRVHILRSDKDYSGMSTAERALQSFRYDNQILVIGIQ